MQFVNHKKNKNPVMQVPPKHKYGTTHMSSQKFPSIANTSNYIHRKTKQSAESLRYQT